MSRLLIRVMLLSSALGASAPGALAWAEDAAADDSWKPRTLYAPERGWIDVDSIAFSGDGHHLGALIRDHGFWDRALDSFDECTLKAIDPKDGTARDNKYSEESGTYQLVHVPYGKSQPLLGQDELLLIHGVPRGYHHQAGKTQLVLRQGVSGKELASFSYLSNGMSSASLAMSPTEPILALALSWLRTEDGAGFPERSTVELLSLPEGKQVFKFASLDHRYHAMAFSPDGRHFAAAGGMAVLGAFTPNERVVYRDKHVGKLHIWETATGEEMQALDLNFQPSSLAFSPDGKVIAVGGYDGIYDGGANLAWLQASTGKLIGQIDLGRPPRKLREKLGETRVASLAFSPDGRFLAAGVGAPERGAKWGEVRLIENESMQVRCTLLRKHPFSVPAVIFSHDGKWLAAATQDDKVLLWDMTKLQKK